MGRWCAFVTLMLVAGCLGDDGAPTRSDAGYAVVDQAPACRSNNDGVLSRDELPFVLGGSARYLQNPDGTVATVDPVGEDSPDGPTWDFTSTAGEAIDLPILPVAGTWFEAHFPGATYATYTDLASKTLGVFRLGDAGLQIMGYVSEAPNETLLVYDQPVDSIRFPLAVGDTWTMTGHVVNGLYQKLPVAETDTYKITVDEKGVVVLPFLRVNSTLRIRIEFDQALPGGLVNHTLQLLYFRECVGEVGRMVSPSSMTGEPDPNFTSAAVFRRLAL
jgi:hypothetical protein